MFKTQHTPWYVGEITYNMLVEAWGLSPRLREHAYRVPRPFLPYMGYLGSLGATPETWEISL